MTATAYPLAWPRQFPRAKHLERGTFKTALPGALKNVQDSLRLFAQDSGKKLDGLVISSNVTLGAQKPADPGVDMRAAQRQHGMEQFFGGTSPGAVMMADVFSDGAPIGKPLDEGKTVLVCENCALTDMPVAVLAERAA